MNSVQPLSSIDTMGQKLYSVLENESRKLEDLAEILKKEQQCILDRRTAALTEILPEIDQLVVQLNRAQIERENLLKQMLEGAEGENQPGLVERMMKLPETIRQHCLEMAHGVERGLKKVHDIGWQNQMLLSQAVRFLQNILSPILGTKQENLSIYGSRGKVVNDNMRQFVVQGVG